MAVHTSFIYDNAEFDIDNGVAPTLHHEGQSFSDKDLEVDFENIPVETCLGCGADIQFKLVMGMPVAFERGTDKRLCLTVAHICPDED